MDLQLDGNSNKQQKKLFAFLFYTGEFLSTFFSDYCTISADIVNSAAQDNDLVKI